MLKTLLLFNYYFLFEFGVIARSYSLGIFLIFFYLSFQSSRNTKLNKLALLALILSPHVSIYSLIVSSALFLPRFIQNYTKIRKKAFAEALLFTSSCFLALLQMLPASDQSFAPPVGLSINIDRLKVLTSLVGEVFLYIPNLTNFPSIWNTNLEFPGSFQVARCALFFILFSWLLVVIYKKRRVLAVAAILGSCVLLGFSYFKFIGGLRHMSHLLLIMLSFYWLAQEKSPREIKISTKNILMALFSISMGAGIIMYTTDLTLPFSDAKNASQVISESDKLIIGVPDYAMTTISGFIGGKEIYHLNTKRLGTYVKWNHKSKDIDANFKDTMIEALETNKSEEALFISSVPSINQRLKQIIPQELIYESHACIIMDECFAIFKIRRQQLKSGL